MFKLPAIVPNPFELNHFATPLNPTGKSDVATPAAALPVPRALGEIARDVYVPITSGFGVLSFASVQGKIRALGLHGVLPAGAIAIAAPSESTAAVERWITSGGAWWGYETHATPQAVDLPAGAVVLLPGEVHDFGSLLPYGLCVAVLVPGVVTYRPGTVIGALPNVLSAQQGWAPYPLLRVWHEAPPAAPLPYRTVPRAMTLYMSSDGNTGAADPTIAGLDDDTQVAVPVEGVTTLALSAFKATGVNEATTQYLASGDGAFDVEIYWKMIGGLWAHDPEDDFVSTGRGQLSSTNACDRIDVPPGAVAFYMRAPSTPAITIGVHVFGR